VGHTLNNNASGVARLLRGPASTGCPLCVLTAAVATAHVVIAGASGVPDAPEALPPFSPAVEVLSQSYKKPWAITSGGTSTSRRACTRPKAVRLVRPVRHALAACVSGWAASAWNASWRGGPVAPSGRRTTSSAAERNFQGGQGRETGRRW
jgi:hypothetical protein